MYDPKHGHFCCIKVPIENDQNARQEFIQPPLYDPNSRQEFNRPNQPFDPNVQLLGQYVNQLGNYVQQLNQNQAYRTNMQPNRSIQFDEGEFCNVSVHNHPLVYMSRNSWNCDGRNLLGGCMSRNPVFKAPYRFRCEQCDFDLCVNCVLKYAIQ